MIAQLDMFRYPYQPGWKKRATSRAAAHGIKPRAATLRERALQAIMAKASTADEVAAALGESILAIRPRLTELAKQGLIRETSGRRPNASGRPAIVWEGKE